MGSRTCASSSRLPTRRSTGPNAPGRTRPSGRASLLTAMGLLDDAIREHLELKRRHGADPQEVARQEDEALGPIAGREPDDDEHDDELEGPEIHEDQLALVDEPPAPYEPPAAEPELEDEPDLPAV